MAKRINCPAPLPKDQEFQLLVKMLFPAPYEVPEKTAKKAAQGAQKGLHRRSIPDETSGSETSSSSTNDGDEEEEENDSPLEVGRKKRAAPTSPKAKAPKRVKGSLVDNSAWDVNNSPERRPRNNPRDAS